MIKLGHIIEILINVVLLSLLLVSSVLPPGNSEDIVRAFTRSDEFDFVSWTVDALSIKQQQAALGLPRYLSDSQQRQAVQQYLDLVKSITRTEDQIELIYADPSITNKEDAISPLTSSLSKLKEDRGHLGPVAEEIFQNQVSSVLADFGIAVAGQLLPPLLYHVTPLPYALIISPRNKISEDNDIS